VVDEKGGCRSGKAVEESVDNLITSAEFGGRIRKVVDIVNKADLL
jgi:hypothetical protein